MKSWQVVLLAVLLACAAAAYYVISPYGPERETFVEIAPGMGTAKIAVRLKESGIIRSRPAFEAYRLFAGGTLKAGEYRFDHKAKLADVYRRIERGDVYTITLVVAEGYNIFDIAQAVENAGLGKAADFLAAERSNSSLVGDLEPQAGSLEGFLFPDTYRFSRHATPRQMLEAMVRRFRRVAVQLGLPGGAALARSVTLASLIEKEVNVDAERPIVAGVFMNRMAQGMPLATDPSVVYAALLDGHWRGTIYQSDLQSTSAYNTYRRAGLPPGPIANPGIAALRAAAHPAKTDFLYFVADGRGHSQFSVGLKEHEEQVQAYRRAAAAE